MIFSEKRGKIISLRSCVILLMPRKEFVPSSCSTPRYEEFLMVVPHVHAPRTVSYLLDVGRVWLTYKDKVYYGSFCE
jgi:hypothetical protein